MGMCRGAWSHWPDSLKGYWVSPVKMIPKLPVTVICVSPWYVYPRTHIPSDMCIPSIWLPVKCVSPTPHPSKEVLVLFLLFFWIWGNHRQGGYKWFKIMSNIIDKRATIREKIITKPFLASFILLHGPQFWCKHSFLSLSSVIIILCL